ncbi:MAG TPA: SulP family inorganic anion transporter [Candidatus Adamsella sp.]|nr:SulP family inorganic anion transporter [Candidatus Adamsella sp.]
MQTESFKNFLSNLRGDVLGGIVSAIVALPQALAFGVATGMGASAGMWGAIIMCLVAGILGTKLPMISGPTGPVAIVTASIMAAYNYEAGAIVTVLLLAAIIQTCISFTSLPSIVKYVPYPVISGFMNGVGTILILMQLNPLVGQKTMSTPLESLKHLITDFQDINTQAVFLGVLTLMTVFLIPQKINRFIPSQIIALVLCTFISIKAGFQVDKIADVSINLPHPVLPEINFDVLKLALPFALTLAVVCSSESMLTALVADSLTREKSSPKRLLLSQGIGNILCAMTGSMSGSAATMRTVAAINTGASTKFAAVVNPLFLIIVLMTCAEFVKEIPLAVLAGILIKIGYDIVDTKFLKVIKYAPKDDLYVLALVFLLTVFYNLIFAVGAGITLAALLYAKRVADKTSLEVKNIYSKEIFALEEELVHDYKYLIRVVHIDGQFFFGSATQIVSHFDEMLGTKYLILNYESNALLDISAIFALEDIIIRLQTQHIKVMLVIKNEAVLNQLRDLNITSQIGAENVFYDEKSAVTLAKTYIKNKFNKP